MIKMGKRIKNESLDLSAIENEKHGYPYISKQSKKNPKSPLRRNDSYLLPRERSFQ